MSRPTYTDRDRTDDRAGWDEARSAAHELSAAREASGEDGLVYAHAPRRVAVENDRAVRILTADQARREAARLRAAALPDLKAMVAGPDSD